MRTRLGVFILIIIALAPGATAFSQRAVSIQLRFPSGENLATGAPVRASGVVVGELIGVELGQDGAALAEAEIRNEAAAKIPSDSVAILAPGGIDLILGDSQEPIHPGITLAGYRTLSELRLESARESVDKMLDELQKEAESLGRTIKEKGKEAGEVLREELERLRRKLEESQPEEPKMYEKTKSI